MAQVDGTKQFVPVKVDFTNPQLVAQLPKGSVSAIDPTQDAWEVPPPPVKGLYRVKLFLSDQGVTIDYRDRKNPKPTEAIYIANLELRIVDNKEYDNRILFASVSTGIRSGKAISTMIGLLLKMGLKMNAGQNVDDLTVVQAFMKVLAKEPVLQIYLDWQGGYKPEATAQDQNPRWKNVFKTMDEWPVVNGIRQHIWMYNLPNGTREEIRAQGKVVQWFGANEKAAIPTVVTTVEEIAAPEVTLGSVGGGLDFGGGVPVNAGAGGVSAIGDELAFG